MLESKKKSSSESFSYDLVLHMDNITSNIIYYNICNINTVE